MKRVELTTPLEKMLVGLDIAANAVGGTLGPRGRNGFIDDPVQPRITNDGKTIADSITLPDKLENLGAWVVKNTSAQTNDDAGDGTTTTAVVLQSIIHEALKRPENAMEVAQSLLATTDEIVAAIKDASQEVTDVKQVALTSTEDEELASLITEVITTVGKDGVILVEENNEPKLSYEIVQGYEANVGFLSPYFANVEGKPQAEFKNVAVLCSEKRIGTLGDIEPIFTILKEKKINELVIVCEDIDASILGILIQNKMMGRISVLVVKATGPLLQDIAAAVGATPISDSMGLPFDKFTTAHLGQAEKVISTEKKTIFLANHPSAIEQANRLEAMAKDNPNQWEARKAMERVHKLRGGMAVIRVGAPTTLGMGYLKDKADDAVHATQAALEEGIVEGGGMCLWRIAQNMRPQTIGERIMEKALQAPMRKILSNAGVDYTEIVPTLYADPTLGYDTKQGTYVNLIEEGIVDPAKVERCAVTNAIANAAKFLTAHVAIVDHVETK